MLILNWNVYIVYMSLSNE